MTGDCTSRRAYRLSLAPEVAAEESESFFEAFCSFQSLGDDIARKSRKGYMECIPEPIFQRGHFRRWRNKRRLV
jgi:hypothetical protein